MMGLMIRTGDLEVRQRRRWRGRGIPELEWR